MKKNSSNSVIGMLVLALLIGVAGFVYGYNLSAKYHKSGTPKIESTVSFEISRYYTVVRYDGQVSELWLDSDMFNCKVTDNPSNDSWDLDQNGHDCHMLENHPSIGFYLDTLGIK